MTEDRTTRYLFEFVAGDVSAVETAFTNLITNLNSYEAQIGQIMARIDAMLGRGVGTTGVAPIAQPAVPQTAVAQATQQQAQALQQAQTIAQQFNATQQQGTMASSAATGAIRNQTQATQQLAWAQQYLLSTTGKGGATPSTGVNPYNSYLMPQAVQPPNQNVISEFLTDEKWQKGVIKQREITRAFEDTGQVVGKTTEYFNKHGRQIGSLVTEYTRLDNGLLLTRTSMEGVSSATRGGSIGLQQFGRHLMWIGQGIALWGAINTVSSAVNEWFSVQTKLNSALAEFEMRTGATGPQLEEFKQQVRAVSIETATPPTEVAQAMTYADPETARQAARLRMVAGGDQQELTSFLIAQQYQFNIPAKQTEQILDALASGWRVTNIPMAQYINMLRDAAPLAGQFGMSLEQMYAFMGGLQKVTAAEGRELDFFLRSLDQVYDADVQAKLRQSGAAVQTTWVTPQGQVQRIPMVDALKQLHDAVQTGKIDLQELTDALGLPEGRVQTVQFQKMMLSFDEMTASMNKALGGTSTFADTFAAKMDTMAQKTDAMRTAWENLLAAMGNTGGAEKGVTGLTMALELLEAAISKDVSIEDWSKRWEYNRQTNKWGVATDWNQWPDEGRYAKQQKAPIIPTSPNLPSAPQGPMPLGTIPSVISIPEGLNFNQMIAAMNRWETAIETVMGGVVTDSMREQVLVLDENTNQLRVLSVFMPALQRAIAENTAQQRKRVDPALRQTDLDLNQSGGLLMQWVQYYTQFLNKMGFPQESKPQLVLGENDSWLRMWASNEALMLALKALTEATEEQTDVLSGMWNVPEGATIWVPIQSLFYSRKQGGESGGALPSPPTTLPPQQGPWGGMAGATGGGGGGKFYPMVTAAEQQAQGQMIAQQAQAAISSVTGYIQNILSSIHPVAPEGSETSWSRGEGGWWDAAQKDIASKPYDKVSQVTTGNLEATSPNVDLTTASTKATMSSMSAMMASAVMTAASMMVTVPTMSVAATSATLSGTLTTGIEGSLVSILSVLLTISSNIAGLRAGTAGSLSGASAAGTTSGKTTVNVNLGKEKFGTAVAGAQYENFQGVARMKTP